MKQQEIINAIQVLNNIIVYQNPEVCELQDLAKSKIKELIPLLNTKDNA